LKEQFYQKKTLEFQIQQTKGELSVMKHMPYGEGSELKNKMDELNKKLKEKEDELGKMQSHTNTLIVKDRESNAMLQEARDILEEVCYLFC